MFERERETTLKSLDPQFLRVERGFKDQLLLSLNNWWAMRIWKAYRLLWTGWACVLASKMPGKSIFEKTDSLDNLL